MSIPGAGLTVRNLLKEEFARRRPDLHEFDFKLANATDLSDTLDKIVSVFLYRVSVDPTRRHIDLPRTAEDSTAQRQRTALSLELRYLLTVWSNVAETEQMVLGEVMSILDSRPILSGDALDTTYHWDEGVGLKVAIDDLSTEDMLRLWDGLAPQYRLSVPYVVRTVRLTGRAYALAEQVKEKVDVHTPRVR